MPRLPVPWIDDPISDLMLVHFPELGMNTPESVAFKQLGHSEQQARRDEANQFRLKLQQSSDEELQGYIDEGKALVRKLARAREESELAKPFYDHTDAEVDLEHWSRVAYWTLDEAAALSLGKDPRKVDSQKLRGLGRETRFSIDYAARLQILERAHSVGQLRLHTPLTMFLLWIERTKFTMPETLIEAANVIHEPGLNWKTKYQNLLADRARQSAEFQTGIAKLGAELADLEPTIINEITKARKASLGIRERESLLKLVIGMAVEGYRYDPKANRSDIIGEIAGDLEKAGIPLDADTVRKYLYEARDLLPPRETEQKR